jgi:hypothetical protein
LTSPSQAFSGSSVGHRRTLKQITDVLKPLLELPQSAPYLTEDVIADVERIAQRIAKRTEGPRVMIEGAYVLMDLVNLILFKFQAMPNASAARVISSNVLFHSLLKAFMNLSSDELTNCYVLRDHDLAGTKTRKDYKSFLCFLELPLTIAGWDRATQSGSSSCMHSLQATIAGTIAPRLLKLILDVTQVGYGVHVVCIPYPS